MQFRIERDLSHTYLIPDVKTGYIKEDYQMHMLLENQISGLLNTSVHHMDGMSEFCYDVTAMQSLTEIYESDYMNEQDILELLRSLYDVLHENERYLLNANNILLSPGSIFRDKEKEMWQFCYFPGYEGRMEDSFCELAEYILHHLNQNDAKAVLLGFEIYRQASQRSVSLEMILHMAFEKKEKGNMRIIQGEPLPESRSEYLQEDNSYSTIEPVKETKKKEVKEAVREKKQPAKRKAAAGKHKDGILIALIIVTLMAVLAIFMWKNYLTTTQGGGIAFLIVGIFGFILSEQKKECSEEQNKLVKKEKKHKKKQSGSAQEREKHLSEKEEGDASATMVLWEGEEIYQPKLSLIGMNSRDRITVVLQKDTYLVGKQKSRVDICVNDPAVSRIHARIAKGEDGYYVSDLNSTNGTYHNGRRLEPGEKVRLELTDEVTFADSGFYVGNS